MRGTIIMDYQLVESDYNKLTGKSFVKIKYKINKLISIEQIIVRTNVFILQYIIDKTALIIHIIGHP